MKPNIFKNCVRQQVNGTKQCGRKTTLTSIGAAIVSLCKKQQTLFWCVDRIINFYISSQMRY